MVWCSDLSRSVRKLSRSRTINVQQPLSELGLDSLMALELRNALSKGFGHDLPATLLFYQPTIAALADYMGREVLAPLSERQIEKTIVEVPAKAMHDRQDVLDI